MIDVITTIDELNKVIDKLDNAKSSTDVNVLVSGIEDAVDAVSYTHLTLPTKA